MYNEFLPWNGSYEKFHYDVELLTGEIVKQCWPNAGFMCAIDGRRFEPKDVKAVRL